MPPPPFRVFALYIHHWPLSLSTLLPPPRQHLRTGRGESLLTCHDIQPQPGPSPDPGDVPMYSQSSMALDGPSQSSGLTSRWIWHILTPLHHRLWSGAAPFPLTQASTTLETSTTRPAPPRPQPACRLLHPSTVQSYWPATVPHSAISPRTLVLQSRKPWHSVSTNSAPTTWSSTCGDCLPSHGWCSVPSLVRGNATDSKPAWNLPGG